MKNNYRKECFKGLKATILLSITLFALLNTMAFTHADYSDNFCQNVTETTINVSIEEPGLNIDFNLSYYDCYVIGENGTFTLTITPNQLNGFIVPVYLQIYFESDNLEYPFQTFLGGVAMFGSPYEEELELRCLTQNGKNATGEVYFKLGYLINGTEFGQINSIKSSTDLVKIVNPNIDEGDLEKVTLWFLFFEVEVYQFVLLVIGTVILVIFLIKRKKNKEKALKEQSTQKDANN